MRRRTRAPRPSFLRPSFVVVTLASAAVSLQACAIVGSDADTPCPQNQPSYGASCTGGSVCTYGNYCGGFPGDTEYTCTDGKWKVTRAVSCNPPPPKPVCPPSAPSVGSACFGYSPFPCSYPNDCTDRPSGYAVDEYSCSTGTWQLVPSTEAKCPDTAPISGSTCDCAMHRTKPCAYAYCGSAEGILATCDSKTRKWTVVGSTCNPPPPDAGFPPEAGSDGGDAGGL